MTIKEKYRKSLEERYKKYLSVPPPSIEARRKNIAKYVKLHNDNVPLLYHKPDIVFLTFVETGDEAEFENIVELYEQGTPKKINKK